jgi:hypothetical protein
MGRPGTRRNPEPRGPSRRRDSACQRRYAGEVRLQKLPGWIVDNATSVREEVAPYVDLRIEERWRATQRCCRAAAAMLRFNRNPERALAYRDPLPESTLRELARLRTLKGTR